MDNAVVECSLGSPHSHFWWLTGCSA